MSKKGYIIFDETWHRLVRYVNYTDELPALWQADPVGKDRQGPTLFKTKRAAYKAIRETRAYKNEYAWAKNNYQIFEVIL